MISPHANKSKTKKLGTWIIAMVVIVVFFQSCHSPYKYLKKKNHVECEFIGFKARPSKSYHKYKEFRDETEIEKLEAFALSDNIVLRTYSYSALIENLEHDYLEIMDAALRDENTVIEYCGCTVRTHSIAHIVYMNYFEQQIDYESDEEVLKIKKDSKKHYQLDSLILIHPVINEDLVDIVLNYREYEDPKILNRIIDLAFKKEVESAKIYIDKNYQKGAFQKIKKCPKQ